MNKKQAEVIALKVAVSMIDIGYRREYLEDYTIDGRVLTQHEEEKVVAQINKIGRKMIKELKRKKKALPAKDRNRLGKLSILGLFRPLR